MIKDGNGAFVRQEIVKAELPPVRDRGVLRFVRDNFCASPLDTLVSLLILFLLAMFLPSIIRWLFLDSVWFGMDRRACLTVTQGGVNPEDWSGACWAFIGAKLRFFIYGYFPETEYWRVNILFFLFAALLIPLAIPRFPWKLQNIFLLAVVLPCVGYVLLLGNSFFGLPAVSTSDWGGILVTLIISFIAVLIALPLGVILALARRSKMPVIHTLAVIFIECVRGVPLITVLFVANIVLPLFLPPHLVFDQFFRILIGFGLFSSAYVAEVLRGGLQGIHKGQYEGAQSLGLTYFQTIVLIVLPQVFRSSLPGLVNTFISLFKDTTLIYTISMFDLLGVVRQHFADTDWIGSETATSGLLFAAAVFWLICFGISRYSAFMERYLRTGYR